MIFGLLTLPANRAAEASGQTRPAVVRVEKSAEGWQLMRNGEPYFVKGVGGTGSLDVLAQAGGNSVRTWDADKIEKLLDDAQRHGISVTVGIWLGHERHGFNYNDVQQIHDQAEKVRRFVLQFKDHPAVLMWGLGNEMEGYGDGDNAAIWSAINNLAVLVKKLDPNHPTMTVTAEIGGKRVASLHQLCPDVDIMGINCYGGIASLDERYRQAGGTKPYVVAEFGPAGVWETKKNSWGAAHELTSSEKAQRYLDAYHQGVEKPRGRCLGGYAFIWGNKQEATATWFGMLLPDGSRLGAVDALTEAWTGHAPVHRCPQIEPLKLAGNEAVEPRATVKAALRVSHPDGDKLSVNWVLQQDPDTESVGGDHQDAPPTFPEAVVQGDLQAVEVKMPADGGAYRLYAYVKDQHGGAAVANLPLKVNGPVARRPAATAKLPLVIYDEASREKPAYIPAGFMGNTKALRLDPECTDRPHTGKTCLKAEYTAKDQWGGVVWQDPANDWGDRAGGYDLSGAKQLKFWARGASGGEVVTFELGIIKKDKPYHDSAGGKLESVTLTKDWQAYTISLSGKDLSRIKTGFVFVVAAQGEPVAFYLDDILFE